MNYLASPPLVVAYALAGTMDIDLTNEPLGRTRTASRVPARHLADASGRSTRRSARPSKSDMFRRSYAEVFEGDETLARAATVPDGRPLRLGRRLDLRPATRRSSRA